MIQLEFKGMFFDRKVVVDQLDESTRKAMASVGAFARRVARNSIKRKGAARKPPKREGTKAYERWLMEQRNRPRSPAGSPPFQHTTSPIVAPRNVQFAFDGKRSVVVGMVGVRRRGGGGRPAPHEIEFGSEQLTYQPRARVRKIGDGGEVEIGRRAGGTTKTAFGTSMGTVSVTYATLQTSAQVDRANQINRQLYGQPVVRTTTAPRPVTGPAFGAAVKRFEQAFSGRLAGV